MPFPQVPEKRCHRAQMEALESACECVGYGNGGNDCLGFGISLRVRFRKCVETRRHFYLVG